MTTFTRKSCVFFKIEITLFPYIVLDYICALSIVATYPTNFKVNLIILIIKFAVAGAPTLML